MSVDLSHYDEKEVEYIKAVILKEVKKFESVGGEHYNKFIEALTDRFDEFKAYDVRMVEHILPFKCYEFGCENVYDNGAIDEDVSIRYVKNRWDDSNISDKNISNIEIEWREQVRIGGTIYTNKYIPTPTEMEKLVAKQMGKTSESESFMPSDGYQYRSVRLRFDPNFGPAFYVDGIDAKGRGIDQFFYEENGSIEKKDNLEAEHPKLFAQNQRMDAYRKDLGRLRKCLDIIKDEDIQKGLNNTYGALEDLHHYCLKQNGPHSFTYEFHPNDMNLDINLDIEESENGNKYNLKVSRLKEHRHDLEFDLDVLKEEEPTEIFDVFSKIAWNKKRKDLEKQLNAPGVVETLKEVDIKVQEDRKSEKVVCVMTNTAKEKFIDEEGHEKQREENVVYKFLNGERVEDNSLSSAQE